MWIGTQRSGLRLAFALCLLYLIGRLLVDRKQSLYSFRDSNANDESQGLLQETGLFGRMVSCRLALAIGDLGIDIDRMGITRVGSMWNHRVT